MKKRLLGILLISILVLAGCLGGQTPRDTDTSLNNGDTDKVDGNLELHFINVGQSVSTLIIGPTGETLLIDTGDFKNKGEHVLNYLKNQGVERIDYLVSSHADADHIGGHSEIIQYYETQANGIGAIYDPGITSTTQTYESYLDAVEKYNVTLYTAFDGDTIPFEATKTRILAPPQNYLANRDRNENSIVLQIKYGNTSFLFTGDAEKEEESYIIQKYGEGLRSTVLKAGHHGSKTSTGTRLLETVDPKAVVISSAYDSRYGHPHQEVLERLSQHSIKTYWTAVHGDIVLVSNGSAIEVKTQREATTDPLSLREESGIEPGTDDSVETRTVIKDGIARDVVTDGGTDGESDSDTDGEPSLELVDVHADAEGNDNENLNDEYIALKNSGDSAIELSGWTVEDEAGHTYTFPNGFTLDPDQKVVLRTGSGSDGETVLYWGSGNAVWNNGGDTITVKNEEGEIVLEESY